MLRILAFVLCLAGCSMPIESRNYSLKQKYEQICPKLTKWTFSFFSSTREGCLRSLNFDYKDYNSYIKRDILKTCNQVLNEWKTSWNKVDQEIISKSKTENTPLPDNFKTAEEIFREYPNPCQDNDQFWKQVKEYENKEKQKVK